MTYTADNTNGGERILRQRDVTTLTGLGRSAIYDRMAAGTFPKAFRLGGAQAVGWKLSEVQEWIDGLERAA